MESLDMSIIGPALMAIPAIGGLLYWGLPKLLRWWQLRQLLGVTTPPMTYAPGGRRSSGPIRMRLDEPRSPPEEEHVPLPCISACPTLGVGSFLSDPTTPPGSRRPSHTNPFE